MSASFHNLSSALQRSIDEAFDLAVKPTSPTDEASFVGGGFIIDEPPENYIPLSSVPEALSYLNLPSDDEQVLAVFRNAASGWSSATDTVDDHHLSDKVVSRDDWRSVCAVLLGQPDEEENDNSSVNNSINADSPDDGEYRSLEGGEDSGDDSEYEEPSEKSLHRRKHAGRSSAGSSQHSSNRHSLGSMKQRDACLEAYSLFFPGVPLEDVSTRRITVQEIQQAAGTLGTKLTTVEINEMLEMFSSSPDKSMAFDDFHRMMTVAKLV